MREAVAVLGVEAYQLEEPVDAFRARLAVPAPVHPQRLRHDLADRHPRVEGGVRILEDNLQMLPHRPELLPALAGELGVPIANRPRSRGQQLKDGARCGRLAAARLPDQAQGLPFRQVEGDSADRVGLAHRVPDQPATADGKMLDQVADLDQLPVGGRWLRAVCVWRNLGRHEGRAWIRSLSIGPGGSEQAGVAGGKVRRTVTRGRVIGTDPNQRGLLLQAALVGNRAPRGERAGGGKVEQGRRAAGYRPQRTVAAGVQPRQRPEQAQRIRHPRLVEDGVRGRGFDRLACVHHHDPVRHAGHDAEVVGDQDQRGLRLLPGGAERLEHLGLDGHVERGRGLVGDDHVGIVRHGDGDHDTLPHAAGELMRVVYLPARPPWGCPRSPAARSRGGGPPPSTLSARVQIVSDTW